MPKTWVKTSTSWTQIKSLFIKTSGSWSDMGSAWVKTGATLWTKIFDKPFVPTIATQVEVTIADTATKTKKLTGKLYRWTDSTSVAYRFRKSTNNTLYTNISGASGTSTNPGVGLSNILDTYILTQADVTANTTNYFQYVSSASNSTYGTTSESVSYEVSFEMPRDLALTGTKTSTSITVTWDNDTYSGRYEYQYKLTSSTTWSASTYLAPGSTQTSFTITSLTNSTAYDFQVRGWTAPTTNGYGYYGNWASVSVTTNGAATPNLPTSLTGSFISKDSFFLSWTSPTADATHDLATGFDFGASTSNTAAPATEVTGTTGVSSGNWKTITLADEPNNFELISSLSADTTYYGWVRSRNAGGVSSWAVSSAIKTTALKPPNDVTALSKDTTVDSQTSLKFKWTAPAVDTTHTYATSYIYALKTTNEVPTLAEELETADSTASLTIASLTANTTYYFFIKGKNDDGRSTNWVSASGKTKASPNPPGTPTNVSFANPSQSGIRFTWAVGTGGTPTTYVIALSTSTTEPTSENLFSYDDYYYETGNTTASYTFGSLDPSTTYYAWVKARNADGTSTSVRRTATTAAAPAVGRPTWTAAANFQRFSTSIRWGWGNTGTLSPITGTYTTMTRNGMFWEFYEQEVGGSFTASGYKSYTTTDDTRALVRSSYWPYLLTSTGTSPDVTYSADPRYVRVQADSYDYEGKFWQSAWTARI